MSHAPAIKAIQAEMNENFVQRSDTIEALILGALTGEHVFVLGPPGTAKSLLARDFASRFTGSRYFETLLSKNRPDAAILGPYDLNLLRDESRFVRKDEGYLTWANIAFLDELGKMSPTSGHDILSALNERIKHEVSNGRSAHHIPLHMAIAGSNELPAAESEDAAALWDRLLFRTVVDYIAGPTDFMQMLASTGQSVTQTLPYEDLLEAHRQIKTVDVTSETLDAVVTLRTTLRQDHGITVSDRRWRQSIAPVRAAAWLRGSPETGPQDLEVLRLTLWDDLESRTQIERTIRAVVSPELEEFNEIEDTIAELEAQLRAVAGRSRDSVYEFYTKEAAGKIQETRKKLTSLSKPSATARAQDLGATIEARLDAFRRDVLNLTGLAAVMGEGNS